MEIVSLSPNSIRIKSKQATIIVNPQEKVSGANAVVIFNQEVKKLKLPSDAVIINGAGDYEVGGVKFSGTRYDTAISYSFIVDDVNILLIDLSALSKNHQKMRDYDVVIVSVDTEEDVAVATNVAGSAVIYIGDKAEAVVTKAIKEGVINTTKFVTTKDKLSTEVQQILLK